MPANKEGHKVQEQWIRVQLEDKGIEDYQGDDPYVTKGRIIKIHPEYPGDETCENHGIGPYDVCCPKEDLSKVELNQLAIIIFDRMGIRIIPCPRYEG